VKASQVASGPEVGGGWTFLTNHTHVLLCIHRDPDVRLRDIAEQVGVTERAAQKIVTDLAGGGYLTIERVGRRNRYTIESGRPLRHPLERAHLIGELLDLLAGTPGLTDRARRPAVTPPAAPRRPAVGGGSSGR
jgi:hypothetical protein